MCLSEFEADAAFDLDGLADTIQGFEWRARDVTYLVNAVSP